MQYVLRYSTIAAIHLQFHAFLVLRHKKMTQNRVLKQRIDSIGSAVKGNWSLAQQSTLRASVHRVPFAVRYGYD